MTVVQESMFPSLVRPEVPHVSIQEAFDAFHAANPWLLDELIDLAREMRDRYGKTSIRDLMSGLRWRRQFAGVDVSGFKLNNNLSSRYARRIVQVAPDLADAIELRELRAS